MGKLNIAHHKSYHPYRRDNIERVQKDEEAARLQQLKDEGRMTLADSEARIDLLRQSRSKRSQARRSSRSPSPTPSHQVPAHDAITTPSGHINFFSAMETSQSQPSASASSLAKKMQEKEAERGFALAPDARDLRPWYTSLSGEVRGESSTSFGVHVDDEIAKRKAQQRELREVKRKAIEDPMAEVRKHLKKRTLSLPTNTMPMSRTHLVDTASGSGHGLSTSSPDALLGKRLARESAERARAEALIRAKARAVSPSATGASSISGDTPLHRGYGDVYNKVETREAGRRRHWSAR